MIALMYFLMIRPENKRKKQAEEMRNSLKKGDVLQPQLDDLCQPTFEKLHVIHNKAVVKMLLCKPGIIPPERNATVLHSRRRRFRQHDVTDAPAGPHDRADVLFDDPPGEQAEYS